MEPTNRLGSLSKLPLELRNMIWTYIDPAESAVLSSSIQIRHEVDTIFQTLNVNIVISAEEHDAYPSGIDMMDQHKLWPTLYPAFLDFSSPEPERLLQVQNLPFDCFRSITIRIKSPDPEDPGQFVRCWNNTIWLVDLLQRAPHPPTTMKISFEDHNDLTWCSTSHLNASVPRVQRDTSIDARPEAVFMEVNTDLETLLLAFQRLRAVNLSIQMPHLVDSLELSPLKTKIEQTIRCAAISLPFGSMDKSISHCAISDKHFDVDIARRETEWTTWLDYKLDDLSGQCAAKLRLERFAFWSKGYSSNVLSRFYSTFHSVFRSAVFFSAYEAYYYREFAVHAFNPLSWAVISETANTGTNPVYYDVDWRHAAVDRRDGWSIDAWFKKYGDRGIPPVSSEEAEVQVSRYSPPVRGCKTCYNCDYKYCAINEYFERVDSILCRSVFPDLMEEEPDYGDYWPDSPEDWANSDIDYSPSLRQTLPNASVPADYS